MFVSESEQATKNTVMVCLIVAVITLAILCVFILFAMHSNVNSAHEVTRVVTQIVTATPNGSTGNALIDALSGK